MLYAAPRGNLCVTIDPAARWHDGARSLVKYLNYRIERPMLDVPGFSRQLSPQEAWSLLPMLYNTLNYFRKRGDLPADAGKAFLDAELIPLLDPVYTKFNQEVRNWTLAHSRYDTAICWIDHEFTGVARLAWTVRAEPPQTREFTVDGVARVAYRAGAQVSERGVTWFSWAPQVVGMPESDAKLEVYLQKHALARVFERLSVAHQSVTHFLMTLALFDPHVTLKPDGTILVECRSAYGLLGYFVGNIVDGCVLLRSFLFITMQGTAEHERLRRRLHVCRRDIEYMRLDEMQTYMESDLADDAELATILSECGLGHLLALRKLFDGDVMLGQARFMRTYLGLPQAA
jgi:hypothetical protein